MTSLRWYLAAGLIWVSLVVLSFPGRTFLSSDDAMTAAILQGAFGEAPDPRASFVNPVLGALVSGLSSMWPSVGWYGVAVWSILGLVVGSMLAVFLVHGAHTPLVTLAISTLVAATFPIVLRLTFTTSSILAGGAAAIVLLAACDSPDPGKARHLVVLSSVLFIIGAMLRFRGAAVGVLVALPVLVAAVLRQRNRALLSIGLSMLGAVALLGADAIAYSASDWTEYREWTQARAELVDYSVDNPGEVREAANWSVNDWEVFRRYHYFDEDVFGLAAVSAAAEVVEWRRPEFDWTKIVRESRLWLVVGGSLALAGVVGAFRQRVWSPLLLPLVIGFSWVVAIGSQWFRFRWHVHDGILAVGVLAAAALAPRLIRRPDRMTLRAAFMLSLVVLPLAVSHATQRGVVLGSTSLNDGTNVVLEPFVDLSDDYVLLQRAGSLPQAWDPLTSESLWDKVDVLGPGWYAFSPLWRERAEFLGVPDIPRALWEREDVLYVTRRDPPALMERYFLEHDGVSTVACPVEGVSDVRAVWRFTTGESC